jgi:hypothetical protein
VVAGASEHIGLEVEICRVARLRGEQPLDLGQRLVVSVLLVAHDGEIVPGRRKFWRASETALEQCARVLPSTGAHREIGEHSQCRRIVGLPREVRAQEPLGIGESAFDQRLRGSEQLRPGRRHCNVVGPGPIGTRGIA